MTFSDFWTNENNPKLEQSEYMYGTKHMLVLLIVIVLSVMLPIMFSQKSQKAKHRLLYVLAGILLFFEISTRIVNLIILEEYTFANILYVILPREICSVMVWVFIIAIFTKKQILYNFSAIGGLLATIAFLLYPAVGLNRTYMTFTCIYSVVSHMIGFIFCILMLCFGFTKFEFKKIWQVYLCFVMMFLWGALLDFVIFPGSNYMYIVEDPLELGLKFPYQILYGAIIALYILMFYVISTIKNRLSKRKTD